MFRRCEQNVVDRGWSRLMERAQEGDREAFRALLVEIGPVIVRFLRRRVGDSNDLEDVCQEVLLAIYESRHTYEPGRPVEPWMFAIARFVAANHYKRYRSRTGWRDKFSNAPQEACIAEPGADLELRQAVYQLPQSQLEALFMTKIEGLSLTEVSARTGASVGTLKVRVHRAHKSLKESLTE